MRLRTWYHFPVITSMEGRELKTKKGVKGWAGWTPITEAERVKFKELVLCSRCDRNQAVLRDADDGEGLALLHKGWLALPQRSKQLRLRQGTGTNSVYRTRSGIWHPMQRSAVTL